TRGRVLALAVLWPVLAQISDRADNRLLVELLTPTYAPLFAIGMMLFLIHREGPSAAPILIAVLNWTFVIALSDGPYRSLITNASTWGASGTVVAGIITAGILAIVLLSHPRASRLDWRWLTTLGTLTYPLYLLHENIGWWLISVVHGRVGAPTYVTLAIVLIGLCLVSAGIHRWVERPLSPFLRRSVLASLTRE
ncbi:MAG: hypothetical protein JWR83_2988, partial [Aeromicrobium sp.]|nr:hypothetical protein [Aeromicrobium sp.]